MSNQEIIFYIVILFLALIYIYKSLFKSTGCNSCGCSSKKEKKTNCKEK